MGKLSSQKASQMLHDNSAHGKPLTRQQQKYFGYLASLKKAENGWLSKYDDGGELKPSFESYYKTIPSYKNDTTSYSLKEAYNNLPYEDMVNFATSKAHLPDTFKKPNHPTFSDESKFSNDSIKGGHWSYEDNHDVFTPSGYNIINMGGMDKYKQWFKENEPEVILKDVTPWTPQTFKYDDGGPIQPNYNDSDVQLSPNFVGEGYSSPQWKSPAWGGQFENGGEMQYYQNGEDWQPKMISKDGGQYIVNGQPFDTRKGEQLDSLSNRLRDLQFEQTQQLQKLHPSLPIEDILNNANSDVFRNSDLNQKADSLKSLYGDVSIPVNEDFLNTNIQYQNLINNVDQPLPLIGDKEKGLKNFGYRSMLQKYLHPQDIPAYKMLEKKKDGGMIEGDGNNTPSWFENKKNEILNSLSDISITDKLKKLNSVIPLVKMIPGGEAWLKDQAYKIGSQSRMPYREEWQMKDPNRDAGTYIGGSTENRDLVKLALYPDSTKGFTKIPNDIRSEITIPLKDKELQDKYKNIPAYYISGKNSDKELTPKDSIDYDSMINVVGSLLNSNREKKGKSLLQGEKLIQAADSVLNSITPNNSVIYSTSLNGRHTVAAPYNINDNLAGYTARIRRDSKTNDLHYDANDVWDFDKDYGSRWGHSSDSKDEFQQQADALSQVTKPFYLMSSNPVAHKKTQMKVKNAQGGQLKKLDDLTNFGEIKQNKWLQIYKQ